MGDWVLGVDGETDNSIHPRPDGRQQDGRVFTRLAQAAAGETTSGANVEAAPNNLNPHVVQARKLTKIYGKQNAVDGIEFEVRRGEAFGLLGPNGAGKSTTMRMIACRTTPTSGELAVEGLDVRTRGREIRSSAGHCAE